MELKKKIEAYKELFGEHPQVKLDSTGDLTNWLIFHGKAFDEFGEYPVRDFVGYFNYKDQIIIKKITKKYLYFSYVHWNKDRIFKVEFDEENLPILAILK